jgi:hypothetical protein
MKRKKINKNGYLTPLGWKLELIKEQIPKEYEKLIELIKSSTQK